MNGRVSGISEDWLAVILGAIIFLAALAVFAGVDLLGWVAAPKTWTDPANAVLPVSAAYKPLGSLMALLYTYLFTLALMGVSAWLLGASIVRFVVAYTIIFVLAYLCWVAGHYAFIAVTTPADQQEFGLSWSLKLTGESGYLIALLVGLAIANFLPGFARMLGEATRPELFIKTAIVVLGAALGTLVVTETVYPHPLIDAEVHLEAARALDVSAAAVAAAANAAAAAAANAASPQPPAPEGAPGLAAEVSPPLFASGPKSSIA